MVPACSAKSIALAVLLCLPPSLSVAAGGTPTVAGAVLKEETRVYMGRCFFADKQTEAQKPDKQKLFIAPALGGALAVAAGEVLVDFTIGALKAAAEDKSAQAVATYPANGWLYAMDNKARVVLNKNYQCIQVVSGSYWDGLRTYGGNIESAPALDDGVSVLRDNRVEVTETDADKQGVSVARWKSDPAPIPKLYERYRQLRKVRFFFEARIAPMENTTDKIVVAPNALYFEEPVEWALSDIVTPKRNVLVTISLSGAGSDVGKSFASLAFPFRELPGPILLSPLYFEGLASRPILTPGLADDENAKVQDQKAKLKSATADVTLYKGPPPRAEYVPPHRFRDEQYNAAKQKYCDELGKANREIAKIKKATLLSDTECLGNYTEAKDGLNSARMLFDESVAKAKAQFNADALWMNAASEGVHCAPSGEGVKFKANCTVDEPLPNLKPVTVDVTVVETKEGSKFAAFLAKVFEKAQPKINAAIEAATPEKVAEAKEQSQQSMEAYRLAVADVTIAKAKLDTVQASAASTDADKAQAQYDLMKKQVAANQAARKAGVSEPYPLP